MALSLDIPEREDIAGKIGLRVWTPQHFWGCVSGRKLPSRLVAYTKGIVCGITGLGEKDV